MGYYSKYFYYLFIVKKTYFVIRLLSFIIYLCNNHYNILMMYEGQY